MPSHLLLASVKTPASKYKEICLDDEMQCRVYVSDDKSPYQRRAIGLLGLMKAMILQQHSHLQVAYDITRGILFTTGDSPQELVRITFASYNDVPVLHKNTALSNINYDKIFQAFKDTLNIPKPAVWST